MSCSSEPDLHYIFTGLTLFCIERSPLCRPHISIWVVPLFFGFFYMFFWTDTYCTSVYRSCISQIPSLHFGEVHSDEPIGEGLFVQVPAVAPDKGRHVIACRRDKQSKCHDWTLFIFLYNCTCHFRPAVNPSCIFLLHDGQWQTSYDATNNLWFISDTYTQIVDLN